MHTDLKARRRVLIMTYRRYLDADRAWTVAQGELKTWFPGISLSHRSQIGDPGSRVRRLYEQRNRAMLQFEAARRKLDEGRKRLPPRRRPVPAAHLLLVSYSRD